MDDQVPAVSGEPVDSPDINDSSQWEENATAQEQVTLHIEDEPAVELELVERVATEAPQDLWDRLRASFALGNLEGSRSQLAAHERWFESNPEYFERLSQANRELGEPLKPAPNVQTLAQPVAPPAAP